MPYPLVLMLSHLIPKHPGEGLRPLRLKRPVQDHLAGDRVVWGGRAQGLCHCHLSARMNAADVFSLSMHLPLATVGPGEKNSLLQSPIEGQLICGQENKKGSVLGPELSSQSSQGSFKEHSTSEAWTGILTFIIFVFIFCLLKDYRTHCIFMTPK